MRDKLVVGNWKMHGCKSSVAKLLSGLKNYQKSEHLHTGENVKIVVCPPYVFLEQTQNLLQGTKLAWGAQNMAAQSEGPYTGEISPRMLGDFGCRYVLLGHSERRILFEESDEKIAEKFKLAVSYDLIPILCIGETQEQRLKDQTYIILKRQLEKLLEDVSLLRQGILAYEPVWAIGTGLSAHPQEAQDVYLFLRQLLGLADPNLAQRLSILYGGSLNSGNAKKLFEGTDFDGGLVGGASLDAREFFEIYKSLFSRVSA